MNLIAEEKIVYTVPAPRWARRKVRELGGIAPDEKGQAQREEIIASLPLLIEYRLTFRSATLKEEAVRAKYIRSVSEWFEGKYQVAPHLFNRWFLETYIREIESSVTFAGCDALDKDSAAAIYLMTLDIGKWATVMTCLRKVETRKRSMVIDDDPPWEVCEIPVAWEHFESFIDSVPDALFSECVARCDDLNPGVWATAMDDDAKNFGGVRGTQ